ncbi:DNA polymerase III subunit delta [Parvularcula maris]|uniref:DNA-directed DNA polymerase n=1 Tax=Parvularcula maris TaxID=2965077 RepID=A0A9X2RL63_9PROT|nr:DNA polymerase III subunit delta [Parvularcula maris]
MTALKGAALKQFLEDPAPGVVCALVYGPEQGLVAERARMIAKAVAEDLDDPWRSVTLSDQDASDAAKLTDEAAAQSFLGGRRAIRVRSAGPQLAGAVTSLLTAAEAGTLQGAGLVVIEAGDLKKTSALRKVCEKSTAAAAIPCYAEGGRDAMAAIRRQLADEDLTIGDEALMLLSVALGESRGLLRQEVEKLILYKGTRAQRQSTEEVTPEDVRDCLAEVAQDDAGAALAAFSGRTAPLSDILFGAEELGTSPVTLLRQAQNRVLRLLPAAKAIQSGDNAAGAMRKMKPPVFFKEEAETKRQLERWTAGGLEAALTKLYEAEAATKITGAPARLIAERALFEIARGSGR